MQDELDINNKIYRFIWDIFYIILFRFTPSNLHKWRVFILNSFGAQISYSAHIYPSSKIFNPKNLCMEDNSCLGPNTICFNVAKIFIKKNSTISQNCHLCAASRKYNDSSMKLITKPIIVEEGVWVAADCFVGPGVKIRKKSVLLARTVLLRSTHEYSICQGNPGKNIGSRKIN